MPVVPPETFDFPGVMLGEFPEIPDLGRMARYGATVVLGQGQVLMGHGDWGPIGLISILPTKKRVPLGGEPRTPEQLDQEALPGPGVLLMFTTLQSIDNMRRLLDAMEKQIRPMQIPIFEVQYPGAERVAYVAAMGAQQAFYFAEGNADLAAASGDKDFVSTSVRVLQISPRQASEIAIGDSSVWAGYLRLRGSLGLIAECDKDGRRLLAKEQP